MLLAMLLFMRAMSASECESVFALCMIVVPFYLFDLQILK